MPEHARSDPRGRIWRVLLGLLALDFVILAASATATTRWLALFAAAFTMVGLAMTATSTPAVAIPIVCVGVVPLATRTWWSIVTPMLAAVAIGVTFGAAHHMRAARVSTNPSGRV